MQKYSFCYAYDVPHYASFTISAPSLAEAKRRARMALVTGRLRRVNGRECVENACRYRVFPCSPTNDTFALPSLTELTATPTYKGK